MKPRQFNSFDSQPDLDGIFDFVEASQNQIRLKLEVCLGRRLEIVLLSATKHASYALGQYLR
jgi:hypothetical protein